MLILVLSSVAGWIFGKPTRLWKGQSIVSALLIWTTLEEASAAIIDLCVLWLPASIEQTEWPAEGCHHHFQALYWPWQHLQPNIWVEISQISPEEKFAQTAAQTLSPGSWNWAETETQMPLISLKFVCKSFYFKAKWLCLLLRCIWPRLLISRVHSERKRRKGNTGQWEAEEGSQGSIYEKVGRFQLQPIIRDACCGCFLTSHYANSAVKTAGNGV